MGASGSGGGSSAMLYASGSAASAFSNIGSAYSQSQAYKAAGANARQIGDTNARTAELQAKDATSRGNRAAIEVKKQAGRVAGDQRVAFAAQGVDVNSGTAAGIQEDTRAMGALDALTIQNNATLEAWGYKMGGINASAQGRSAEISANSQAAQTLLTGGLRAAGNGLDAAYFYDRWRRPIDLEPTDSVITTGRSYTNYSGYA